jgi:hypothetical protein
LALSASRMEKAKSSISRSSSPLLRSLLLTHESFHGVFFSLPGFRDATEKEWQSLSPEEQAKRYETLFSRKVPCLVFSRNLHPNELCIKAAEEAQVPIFRCPLVTMKFINLATLALEMMFAPRGTEMGSMVDILGVGVIIRGESGIGKSESVLALIERGYSLVADDITKVKGVLLAPTAIEEVVRDIPQLSHEYQVVVTKKGDIDDITLKVEILPDFKDRAEAIRAILVDQLRLKTNLGYNIEFHEYGGLPRSQAKTKRFIDLRPH